MVRSSSTSSCFKLITCAGGGNDSVDRDDLEAPESKGSSDRSRWSFRKRSARHRVLSNSVASEATSENKAGSDSTITNLATQGSSTIPEKNSATRWEEEKSQLQIPVASKLMEKTENVAAEEDNREDNRADVTADEGSVIIIQAVIRRFLAERILVKHKKIIKLQAAVRGHIVRRHAVGTLRCVQAIVKMQNLVRKRRARLLLQDSSIKEKGKENMDTKLGVTYISIEKLLSNGFARQLLESRPNTKTINIKCDPSKPDSVWRWLERWMSISSTETEQLHGYESAVEQQRPKGNTEKVDNQLETMIPAPEKCQLRDDTTIEALRESEADENVITYNVDNYNFQECKPTVSSVGSSIDESCPRDVGEENSSVSALDSLAAHAKESDVVSKLEPDFFNGHSGMENKQNIPILENPEAEGSEIDAKKPSIGSKKASNPAFVAAQAKFEELSSAANLGRSGSLSNSDVTVGLEADLPVINHVSKTSEIEPADSSLSHTVGSQVNGSECGTELSISSTLDSPDRSEAGVVDSVLEMKSSEEAADNPKNEVVNLDVEEKIGSKIQESDLSHSNSTVHERENSNITVNNEHVSSTITGDSLDAELKPAITAPIGVQMEQEIETSHPIGKSSPEASPKSHVTVPESQGTPSSQVSVKPKKIRSVKNGSHVSTGKKSPQEPNEDYGARNSSERLPKEHKNAKRGNSFSSARTDHSDQEPRDSSSTNSLPSYMQATESARAKALSHNSPKSSPDMQDRDYIRKRHSLPGATNRQGSPRVQRVQQGAKGNGTDSPQERKWRR